MRRASTYICTRIVGISQVHIGSTSNLAINIPCQCPPQQRAQRTSPETMKQSAQAQNPWYIVLDLNDDLQSKHPSQVK